ncbi:transforming growth factor-beta-induced protein ig-h3-like [Oratosquilla oratoria]|uniref:transforming growth factor-beta-induced protein ig-h3-like n=1 Tax=Oratosquilla oratoria TaxID=337810 RepID=UPI003F763C43
MTVNGAQLSPADVKASNGVIHVIDRVLLVPQGDVTEVLAAQNRFSKLVSAVTTAGLLDTLKSGKWVLPPPPFHLGLEWYRPLIYLVVSLLEPIPYGCDNMLIYALVSIPQVIYHDSFLTSLPPLPPTEGPFTVFAPTNAAFDLLPSGVLDSLLEDPEALSDVLLRHVVGMAVCYKAFPDTVTTVNNQTVSEPLPTDMYLAKS